MYFTLINTECNGLLDKVYASLKNDHEDDDDDDTEENMIMT